LKEHGEGGRHAIAHGHGHARAEHGAHGAHARRGLFRTEAKTLRDPHIERFEGQIFGVFEHVEDARELARQMVSDLAGVHITDGSSQDSDRRFECSLGFASTRESRSRSNIGNPIRKGHQFASNRR